MSFAREGFVFIGIAALIAAGTFVLALNRRSWPLWLLAFTFTVVALWIAYFFRDPKRAGARGDHVVISPADGKIVLIQDVDERAFMGGKAVTRQIAGLTTRPIVMYSNVGQQATQGERMGLIRFGSGVDVFLPMDATVLAKVGDHTTAGVSMIGEIAHP